MCDGYWYDTKENLIDFAVVLEANRKTTNGSFKKLKKRNDTGSLIYLFPTGTIMHINCRIWQQC